MTDIAKDYLRRFVVNICETGGLTNELLEEGRELVRRDDPSGYKIFYETLRNMKLPQHGLDWITELYGTEGPDKAFGNEAFRGSTKTTTITETFTAYQIANHPERSNLIVQATGKGQAYKHTRNIAEIIAYNPMWKVWYPEIVPDEDRGWGVEGYWVKNKEIDYGIWQQMRHKDPTLVGIGYKAAASVGSHPTGVFDIDDINDDKNTESVVEQERVNRILTDTLYPMTESSIYNVFNQTPWNEGDALAKAKSTGIYTFSRTPVLEWAEDEEGEYSELLGRWIKPAWPEKFHIKRIETEYKKSGAIGFARMYLLDLEAAKGKNLKWEWVSSYPFEMIKPDWPMFMGVDYASTLDRLPREKRQKRDYCAIVWGVITPSRNLVIMDGINKHMLQSEAYQKVISLVQTFPYLKSIGMESIGKGEEFVTLMQMAPIFMPIMPIDSHKGKDRTKGGRFENTLAEMFRFGRIMISDRETEFLKTFKDQWVSWDSSNKFHDDTLDAVYMMVRAAEGFISVPQLQPTSVMSPVFMKKKKQVSPWSRLNG